ncbi:MAG: preprotein translocase subunit YajC [Bacteroidota bacterium]|nr:preprotein translocase subunit YajC [Bacteroidota bacterium]
MISLQVGAGGTSLVFFMLIFAVMYFFMIRPQIKKQKKEVAFRDALKVGDKVVTIGGIHGKISEIGKSTVVLDVHNSGKLKVEKSAISMMAQTEIQS